MKLAILLFAFSLLSTAQAADINQACVEVRMSCTYDARYNLIDLTFKATGKVMFDKASNRYTRDMKDDSFFDQKPPRFYIGTREQNAKLARNILENKQLFINGRLSLMAAKQWRFVQ
jgi:hypothetical protein